MEKNKFTEISVSSTEAPNKKSLINTLKLYSALQNLSEGIKENTEGAIAWLEHVKGTPARLVVAGSLLFQMATAACNPKQNSISEINSGGAPYGEVNNIPTEISIPPTPKQGYQPGGEVTPSPSPETPSFVPAVNPPEYKPGGGEITGLTQEQLSNMANWELLKVYKMKNGIPLGQEFFFNSEEDYEEKMRKILESDPGMEVKQVQAPGGGEVLTYILDKEGVYFPFTEFGHVAFPKPDLWNKSVYSFDKVAVPEGCEVNFQYNSEDGHWYLFAIDEKEENPKYWFNTHEAKKDNLEKQWIDYNVAMSKPPQVFSISQNNEGTYVGYDEYGEEIGRVEGSHWIRINKESQVSHWYDAEVSEWKELLPGIGYMEKFDPENLTFVEWKDIENGLAHNTAWYLIETGKMPAWPSVNLGGNYRVENYGNTETVGVIFTLTRRLPKDAYPQRSMFWLKTEYNGAEAVIYAQENMMTQGKFPIIYVFLEDMAWYIRDGWFNDEELFKGSAIFPTIKLGRLGCPKIPSYCNLNEDKFPEMIEWAKEVYVERNLGVIKTANYLFLPIAKEK